LDFLKEQKKNGVSFRVINFPQNDRYDVADLELDSLERPVGAIFHLAGTTADKSLEAMSWTEFSGLFASKVHIADGLMRYSDTHPEVPIIFFSSFVSVAGSEGQANYASVNAYLDAVASMGRANITSLGWGPWNGVGMAGRLEKSQLQNLQTQGVELISPARAMSVFNDIELLKGGHQIIAPVNWQRWISRDPIFSDLIAEPGNRSSDDHFLKIIRKRSVKQRKTLMSDHLRALVSSILLLDAGEINVNDRLFDIGVDSLIAMQLKSKLQQDLGVPLGSTLLFDFPTVDRLAHYLVEEFVNPLDETGRDSQRSSKDAPSQNEVDALASALHRLKESLS
jgi:acyl carrier protein